MPLELAVSKFANWVWWKVGKCDTPSWWVELSTVLGENDTRRLAQEVKALFQLPRRMHELEPEEAPFQAPLALPCLHCQRFMPLVVSIYTSRDIREIPREKAVVYARALQHFAEQNNLPKRNKWCLLAESIMELGREVKFYLSFTDEEVFRGVDLPKKEESCPMVPATANITTTADIPGATDVPEVQPVPKPMPEKKAPKYARWEKVLHPSQPVLATGEIPQPSTMLKSRGRAQQLARMITISLPLCLSKAPLPPASPPTSKSIGIKAAAHSAQRLCWSNGLPDNTRSHGGRPGDAHGHYVHRAGNDSRHFKCELKPCGQRWHNGAGIHGHHDNLHREGRPQQIRSEWRPHHRRHYWPVMRSFAKNLPLGG